MVVFVVAAATLAIVGGCGSILEFSAATGSLLTTIFVALVLLSFGLKLSLLFEALELLTVLLAELFSPTLLCCCCFWCEPSRLEFAEAALMFSNSVGNFFVLRDSNKIQSANYCL